MDKLASFSEIKILSRQYKASGKTIVFTNGCFDIIHAGHVKYLSQAASLGDILILGLNSDLSVKTIKGEKRPVIGQDHRSIVVAALACIDHVVLFDEPDPKLLIETICPDVLVKGADWQEDQIIGADFVKKNGGYIKRVFLEPDISTSKIIEKIGKLYYE
ncbi:MAG: D-glycero-beta-D-manno-heptose 1-phosphate adenylyltransferase [Desulfobacula sp.]|jgi:rfaE bifunctional protein nucleotidyltransferase chain/domain|uniref:D-glycero-beta-D-manno-heptose 1-phosphate adenylyltransferase n=1 Tax=Desulfobacula sp. TaxID=2593537 RepID=UPI001DEB1C29|nr:D-glycero-beta-D-manno-heptose 1-phosphate adenylyltransferase [Desulfobacula sp.]MBT3484973.1 D-glycero-beta-D-manno-heptose 1-phosphate adenylyltransferase [Desulfobacula sp.]MBT3803191.1 D-glycero-beta-D-manno-heptose 1-phosphate adenylyltransferase [Desulfobacula sp.]MBT4024574.1 D-glycero-beta-D-manno-heptose 1-phosphate adenylyltransferase [Desulfobacula sp.]MBT4200288.1 D-glycero-beta-D-manno-heptose 1-phosphate adenylyltransferase [Desulfobacula sp.]